MLQGGSLPDLNKERGGEDGNVFVTGRRKMKDMIRLLIFLFICISGAFASQISNLYLKMFLFAIDILLLILLYVTSRK